MSFRISAAWACLCRIENIGGRTGIAAVRELGAWNSRRHFVVGKNRSPKTTDNGAICGEQELNESVRDVERLVQQGLPVSTMLYRLLRRCIEQRDLEGGRRVHAFIIKTGLQSSLFFGDHLVRMYSCCGSLVEAKQVFEKLPARDSFIWSSIITACCQHGEADQAIRLYLKMQESGMEPTCHVLKAALGACTKPSALAVGKLIHSQVIQGGYESDAFIASALIHMYAKCGSLVDARTVFDRLPTRNVVTCTVMLGAYAQLGNVQDAYDLFHQMQEEGMQSDRATFMNLVKACSSTLALDMGRVVHAHILKEGLGEDVFIGSNLINMYSRCGSIGDARSVFDRLSTKDEVAWTAIIAAHVQHRACQEALQLFRQMQENGMQPDRATLLCILKACSKIGGLDQGRLTHIHILQNNLEHHVEVGTSLVDMYANCGSFKDAHAVFDRLQRRDLASWNVIISLCAQHVDGEQVFQLFGRMQQEGMQPNHVTLISILIACSRLCALEHGMLFHGHILAQKLELNLMVVNTLIEMYVKCGNLEDAQRVFDTAGTRDVETWNALLAGYADVDVVIELYNQMQQESIQPNHSTFVSMLQACSNVAAALAQGKLVHSFILKHGYLSNIVVGNSLIDMYGKCGSLEDAKGVFDSMQTRDLVSWNSMIAAYAQHGGAQAALKLFGQMQQHGLYPDIITFLGLLTGCSHEGLLEEGGSVFQSMYEKFNISPELKHYACIVDMLGRRGHLYGAGHFIEIMPVQPDMPVWMSLLGSCRTHGNVEVGRWSYEAILRLDATNTAAHVLMADIYDGAGRLTDRSNMRRAMQKVGAKKEPGRTWMELNSQLHVFGMDDTNHPERKEIHAALKNVIRKLSMPSRPALIPLDVCGNYAGI